VRIKNILLKRKLRVLWKSTTSRVTVRGDCNKHLKDDKMMCCIWERVHIAVTGHRETRRYK